MGRAYLTRAKEREGEKGNVMGMVTYTGEFISAETGEEEPFYNISYNEVMRLLKKMVDGDSLVINCSEREREI